MWRVIVELCVVLGAVGGLGLKITQFVVARKLEEREAKGSPDYEHVKQLERENKELDEMLERIRGEKK